MPGRSRSAEHRRLLTEGALWANLLAHDLYSDLVFVSDDAAQFKLLAFLHALCWVHMERHVAQLIPLTADQRAAHEAARDAIWEYYQRLKAYRESPTPARRARLETDFDRLFLKETGWPELNEVLRKIHGKKSELLLVLDHPEIPLHNNLSENDIRQYVKKRKISAGTRSDAGRRCRDTFLSLKTTCRKLGVTFWRYLQDRIQRPPRHPSAGRPDPTKGRRTRQPITSPHQQGQPLPPTACGRLQTLRLRIANHRVIEKSR